MDLGRLMITLMKSELRTRKSTQEIQQRPVPPPQTPFNQLLQIAGTEKGKIKNRVRKKTKKKSFL